VAYQAAGLRRGVLVVRALITVGHYSLIFQHVNVSYVGLALIVLGTGLLKANISAIVGQLYPPGDMRRDGGFSLFYMGINLGAFLSPLACGYLGQRVGWHWGFGLAALGMTVAVVQFRLGSKHLGLARVATIPAKVRHRSAKQLFLAILICAILAVTGFSVSEFFNVSIMPQDLSQFMGLSLLLVSAGIFVWLFIGARWSTNERRRLVLILVLFLAPALFWSLFE